MVTGFQLKDILKDNYTQDSIKKAILERQKKNEDKKEKMEDARLIASNIDQDQFKEETEEEKKVRWGYPKYDVKKLLEE